MATQNPDKLEQSRSPQVTERFARAGVTCFLTLATMSMDSRGALARVRYATALDHFLLLCFLFVIGAMLQFAAVHYFTKVRRRSGPGERKIPSRRRKHPSLISFQV